MGIRSSHDDTAHRTKKFGTERAELFTKEALTWINLNLGYHCGWPDNFHELEQCVRSVILRAENRPAEPLARSASGDMGT